MLPQERKVCVKPAKTKYALTNEASAFRNTASAVFRFVTVFILHPARKDYFFEKLRMLISSSTDGAFVLMLDNPLVPLVISFIFVIAYLMAGWR